MHASGEHALSGMQTGPSVPSQHVSAPQSSELSHSATEPVAHACASGMHIGEPAGLVQHFVPVVQVPALPQYTPSPLPSMHVPSTLHVWPSGHG